MIYVVVEDVGLDLSRSQKFICDEGFEVEIRRGSGVFCLPMVRVGDINMYYEVHGRGFPLVMVMGTSASCAWWTSTGIKQFSKHFKTVIFDNRGMGRTDVPEDVYTT